MFQNQCIAYNVCELSMFIYDSTGLNPTMKPFLCSATWLLSPSDLDILTCCNPYNNLKQNFNTLIILPTVSFYSNPVNENQQNIAVQTGVIIRQHILVQSPEPWNHREHVMVMICEV